MSLGKQSVLVFASTLIATIFILILAELLVVPRNYALQDIAEIASAVLGIPATVSLAWAAVSIGKEAEKTQQFVSQLQEFEQFREVQKSFLMPLIHIQNAWIAYLRSEALMGIILQEHQEEFAHCLVLQKSQTESNLERNILEEIAAHQNSHREYQEVLRNIEATTRLRHTFKLFSEANSRFVEELKIGSALMLSTGHTFDFFVDSMSRKSKTGETQAKNLAMLLSQIQLLPTIVPEDIKLATVLQRIVQSLKLIPYQVSDDGWTKEEAVEDEATFISLVVFDSLDISSNELIIDLKEMLKLQTNRTLMAKWLANLFVKLVNGEPSLANQVVERLEKKLKLTLPNWPNPARRAN